MHHSRMVNFLDGARVYLSGPMGFVASRSYEKQYGWRNRVKDFLHEYNVVIFDPWLKPRVRGMKNHDFEDEQVNKIQDLWSFENNQEGTQARTSCKHIFESTFKMDMRMVDTSDFLIAMCPTNIYSVGTVHEIIRCREQSKPVLFVSPHIDYPSFNQLVDHLKEDAVGADLLQKFIVESQIKANPCAIPSAWYMKLIDTDQFFDGFGFSSYIDKFGWERCSLDDQEDRYPPKNPLFPYLEKLSHQIPQRWEQKTNTHIDNDDWLIWDLT